ncbi:MAG: hypothetical protein LN417_03575 [Candidatus Thermoplasmatota archaeon]|nr:hypothetical protein [Candidatus Thermoplasmatota archaeon]
MKESSNPDLYVPLRYVKIREVELQGEYTFVHFSVEDFVRYEATYGPDHYSKAISTGVPADEKGLLVTEADLAAPVDKSASNQEADHWAILVGLLVKGQSAAFDKVAGSIFIRFIDIVDIAGNSAKRKSDRSGFALDVDTNYLLELLVVVPYASDRDLDVGSFSVGFEGPFSKGTTRKCLITGLYDRVDFSFKSANEKTVSAISILPSPVPVSVGKPPQPTFLHVPGAAIPVKVAPSASQIATRTAIPVELIAVGLALEGLAALLPITLKITAVISGAILGATGLYFKK